MRLACQRAHVQVHAYVNKIGHTYATYANCRAQLFDKVACLKTCNFIKKRL